MKFSVRDEVRCHKRTQKSGTARCGIFIFSSSFIQILRKVHSFFFFFQFTFVCELSATVLDNFPIKNINMEQLLAMTTYLKGTSDMKRRLMSCNPYWAIQNGSEK